MPKLLDIGDFVHTQFLHGTILERINGAEKRWDPNTYYSVLVERPFCALGTVHIIKDTEVKFQKFCPTLDKE